MEKHRIEEYADEGSCYIEWACEYKGRRYVVRTVRSIRSIEEPDVYVWEVGGIACKEPPYHIPLVEWSGNEEPDHPQYPDAETAADAAALRIDKWLRDHGHEM